MTGPPFPADGNTLPSLMAVDDDVTFCGVLAAALERRGYTVHVAHDVTSAYAIAEQELLPRAASACTAAPYSASCRNGR